MSLLLFVTLVLRQAEENVLERLWRWTEPVREYFNFPWKLGNFVFSLSSLALGLLVFVLSFAVSRYLRRFLERRMQAHPHLDPGVQYTILRLVNYIVVLVGVIAALRIAIGADFTSLAIIFTALSVGIGFGLQFIAGDIAAGFLLLFERPVKVGDFITVTGPDSRVIDGKVISINLRTTIVQNNDNISVIIPNSKLTNENLINWSYRGRRSRIAIPIGVSYASNVDLVTETLLAATEGVKFVLDEPKPSVQFLGFGESSLDFRLLIWTDRPRRHPQIKSSINYNIRRLFLAAGIEIPFPQRDLNLRAGRLSLDSTGRPLALAEDGETDEAQASDGRKARATG